MMDILTLTTLEISFLDMYMGYCGLTKKVIIDDGVVPVLYCITISEYYHKLINL